MSKDRKAAEPPASDRRGFVKTAVIAAAGAVAVSEATAQQPPTAPGRLPGNTPITKLGFNAAEIAVMTPAVQALTKQQLLELQEWARKGDMAGAPEHLTIKDINSLETAYAAQQARHKAGGAAAQDVTACCCCCPCCSCTAAAETLPARIA